MSWTFANVEKEVGPWEFSATFDLGNWSFGPAVLWRKTWHVFTFSIGPASVSATWWGI
jgi:hypothetical protein